MGRLMVSDFFLQAARCPVTRQSLRMAEASLVDRINRAITAGAAVSRNEEKLARSLGGGLVTDDESLLYPVYDGIPCLLADRAVPLAPYRASGERNTTSMSEKTIFKKIIDREIPAEIVYEDEECLALNDITPQAPVHVLVIPKKEIRSLDRLDPQDQSIMGHLCLVTSKLAKDLGLESGWRMVINCGPDAGQSVDHLHIHLLGGRKLTWPPG
jgi:histidine triad (HIT) family protein